MWYIDIWDNKYVNLFFIIIGIAFILYHIIKAFVKDWKEALMGFALIAGLLAIGFFINWITSGDEVKFQVLAYVLIIVIAIVQYASKNK